jgi:DNA replication initiation complex subunit (GINS family)
VELWKKERSNTFLCDIPKDLYISLDGLLTKLNRDIQTLTTDSLAKEILARILFIRQDITRLRVAKIVNLVINDVTFDESVLTWGEQKLVKNLRRSIETIGVEKPNILDTLEVSPEIDQYEDSEAESVQSQKIQENQPSALEYSVVRMLYDVEAFLGLDNISYGPFEKKDIVHLPSRNATALIARGVARLIEIPKDTANGE